MYRAIRSFVDQRMKLSSFFKSPVSRVSCDLFVFGSKCATLVILGPAKLRSAGPEGPDAVF